MYLIQPCCELDINSAIAIKYYVLIHAVITTIPSSDILQVMLDMPHADINLWDKQKRGRISLMLAVLG